MKAKGKKTTVDVVYDLYLSMSEREAKVLSALMRMVGGQPEGPRGVADELQRALSNVGITSSHSNCGYGDITFPNTWEEFLGEEA